MSESLERAQESIEEHASHSDPWARRVAVLVSVLAAVLALAGIGVTDVHFELLDATHGGISWRYPLSLAYLAERLSPVTS